MRKICFFIILFSLVAVQPSLSKVSHPKKNTLSGYLRDNSTHAPIANARVRLSNSNAYSKTGADGKFEISVNVESSSDFLDTLVIDHALYWEKRIVLRSFALANQNILLSTKKQRLIVTSDIGGTDPDDEQSMVHLLVSSNQIDIEGIICGLAWLEGKLGIDVLNSIIDAYGRVLPNLKAHADGYPSGAYFKSIAKTGQAKALMAGVGEGKDSPGSELIIAAADKDDPRPIWLNAWGGANTIAQALWKVKNTRTPDEVNKFVHKIRIYDVLGQDDAGAWITKTFPNLIYIRNKAIYGWGPSDEWVKNSVQSKGVLGAKYPNRIWATEGDSPAFMHLISNGLHDANQIDQGGWGGRFDLTKVSNIRGMDFVAKSGADEPKYDPYFMFTNASEGAEAINRWKQQIWNDFSARMLWSVTDSYNKANHHPLACVNGDCTMQVIQLYAKANSTIRLNASKSSDPDGNSLKYNWFFYQEPSSYKDAIYVANSQSEIAEVVVPQNAKGKTIHIILGLSDDGEPSLTRYRRIVINVE
ncbi:nucleoside hydrolase-like domain-containing protein [Pelobium manganitolerans]|uniref:nucleoside hydrolase-like domain-containing protein n=1 Tax=Pelobium manganitolerans TaxID=1842495 RepID=UPI003FA37035